MALNRRSFVGAFAAGLAALSTRRVSVAAENRTAATGVPPASGTDVVRIMSNENPLGPSPRALDAAMRSCAGANRYARNESRQLDSLLRTRFGLPPAPPREPNSPDRPSPGPDLLLGIGSTEILHAAAWEYSSEPGNIVEPHPSYSVLGTIAASRPGSRIDRRLIPLDDHHRLDLSAMRKAVDADTRLVMICNPNNPTGTTVPRKAIESFIADVPTSALVFVDEAYIEFLPEYEQRSVVAAAMSRPNVLVARTFSKVYGMAGLRVGYAIASGEVIWRLKRHTQGELSPNVPGMAAAQAALEDPQHVQTTVALNNRIQKRLRDELPPLGLKYIPSEASFTWIEVGDDAGKLVRFLFDRDVIIVHGQRWDMPTFIRVSVGTDAEMDRFFAALREYRALRA